MKIPIFIRRKRGVALVITLSAVVLLTVLILAFFSRAQLNRRISFSSTNQVKADLLARSALDIVTGEIRQELDDAIKSASPTDGVIPAKAGVSNADSVAGSSTIVKVAANGKAIRPGGPNMASSVTIDAKSLNGRSNSKTAWFENGPNLGSADLPSWVYLTRGNGAKVPTAADARDPASPDYVVGRFTYTVYETGGLIDANLAGSPTLTTANSPYAAYWGAKGSAAYADLSVLDQQMDSAKVNQLLSWRNASLLKSGTDKEKAATYDEWATGIPRAVGTPNTSALAAPRSGYADVPLGDNTFISRRDLLRYVSAQLPSGVSSFFTHSSYGPSTPAWSPSFNGTGAAFRYADDAKKQTAINRDLQSVKATSEINVTHYRDDGTKEDTLTIYPDESFIRRPFSLAKLAWLGHDGPNSAAFNSQLNSSQINLAIKAAFGLTWNSSKNRWEYSHGDANGILTLDQACNQQKREPDFFEMLKAGILHGSLGNHPGAGGAGPYEVLTGPVGIYFQAGEHPERADAQILQIGANIIDQADRDNYPTAIYQESNSFKDSPYGAKELFSTYFGQENLPMLQRVVQVAHKVDGDESAAGPEDVWMQPEIWNPHEVSTADPTKYTDTPSALRMVTFGGCRVQLTENNGSTRPDVPNTITNVVYQDIDFGNDPFNPQLKGIVSFAFPKPGSTKPRDFNVSPALIEGYGQSFYTSNYQLPSQAAGPNNFYFYRGGGGTGKTRCIGVWLGALDRDPVTYPTHKVEILPVSAPAPIEPHLTFVLQYQDKNGRWLPYSMMARLKEMHGPTFGSSGEKVGYPTTFRNFNAARPDPRTDRFSASAGMYNSSGTTFNYMWANGCSARSGPILTNAQSGGRGGTSFLMPSTTAGFSYQYPKTGAWTVYLLDDWAQNIAGTGTESRFWYSDPDGVVRPGDSWRANYAKSASDLGTGDGAMLYDSTELPATSQRRRPVILNRPFRSAAELGYVFRDQPFRTLDFWSDKSADAGLLELFCASDSESGRTAGKINPNTASSKIFQAIFSGTAKQHSDPAPDPLNELDKIKIIQGAGLSSASEAANLAGAMKDEISAQGPMTGNSQLAGRFSSALHAKFTGADGATTTANQANKTWGEAPLRAMAGIFSSGTWTLLIDVAAQTGRVSGTGLQDFVVEGERRFWLHLTLDRITGKVVSRQLEAIYD